MVTSYQSKCKAWPCVFMLALPRIFQFAFVNIALCAFRIDLCLLFGL